MGPRARKTSAPSLVSPATRFVALESKATKRPSALTADSKLAKLPSLPSPATDNLIVLGMQPAGAPMQVSRRKTSLWMLVSPATRLEAKEEKVRIRASALMAGNELKELPWLPSVATDTLMVLGLQPAAASMQVSRRKTSGTPLVTPATKLVAWD